MAQSTAAPNAKVTLYWLEKSRSQRILWLLEELKIDYDIEVFKRGKDMLAGPDLKKVHPLGKSPVVGISPKEGGTQFEPILLAESGAIVEYLCDYFGKHLIPTRYKPGQENQIGGETEEWIRFRYFMHYAEGSLMTLMLIAFFVLNIKEAPVPFFIKPITRQIAVRADSMFLTRNFETHFGFLEDQLKTSPGGGPFFCGKELTGADILMIFPLEAALGRTPLNKEKYPKLVAWIDMIHERPAYKAGVQKIIDKTGEFDMSLTPPK